MFETIGVPELLIILVIVVLLFGAGRVGRLGKDLGTSVKEFRRAMTDDESTSNPVAAETAPVAQITAPAPSAEAQQSAPAQPQANTGPQIF